MALDFPNNPPPQPGTVFTGTNNVTYVYDGTKWIGQTSATGSGGTVWTNDANGCLRVELSSTGFQAFTDGTHLDLRDDGIWNVGSYQNNTSIGNDGFANPRDLSLRAGDTLFINTNIDTDGYDNQWMIGGNALQTNGKAKIDFWRDNARLGAPAPNGTTDTLTLWNFNGENTIGEFYNYAIGVEGDHIWFAQDTDPTTNTGGFKFYSRGQEVFKIGANGDLMNNNGFTLNAGPRGTITLGKFIEFPGVDEHFHIAFPNSNLDIPYQDLFLGDDRNFVKVRGSHNGQALGVDIGANDRDGGGQKTWQFGTDGTIKFPDNTLANTHNNSLDITADGYIAITSDENVALNYNNTNLGSGPYAPGTLFSSGFSAGENGPTENQGPFMYTAFTPDGVDVEEISFWSIDNSGNLQTIIEHYDTQTSEYSQRTGDIVDQFGNSIIHPVAGDTPPEGATDGRLWFKSDEARLYIMYGSQWIDASPTVVPPPPDAPSELVNGDATVSLQPDGSLLFPNGTGIGNLQHAWGGSANGIDIKSYNNVNGYSQLNWNDRSFAWTDSQGVGLQTHDADGVLIGQVRLNNLGFLETFAGDGDPMYIGQVGDNDSVVWSPDSLGEGYLGLWMGGNRDLAGVGSTANYGPAVSVNVGKPLEDGEYAGDPNTPDGYLVQVNVRGASWYFREDAGLQFPDGSVQTTAAVVDGGNAYSALTPI